MDEPARRQITSRNEFFEAIRSAFSEAAEAAAPEIFLCDSTFGDWPLSERSVIETLTRWVDSRRRLVLFAYEFDDLARRHARWMEWRRQWSHVVVCRSNAELTAAQFPPICLVSDVVSVRLFDRERFRGLASHEPIDGLACRDAIDAVSQRSEETFPVTTLGL